MESELIEQVRAELTEERSKSLTDSDVWRFVVARKKNISKAVAMINHFCDWNDKILPGSDTLTPSNCLDTIDQDEHIYRQYFPFSNLGHSLKGCPIYWEKTGICSTNFHSVNKSISVDGLLIRHIRQQEYVFRERCERASKYYGKEISKQLLVFDLQGLSYHMDTHAISTFRQTMTIDQAYYPERLDHLIMINAPWFFTAIYAMLKPFIDPITAEKILIIGHDYLPTLHKFIDESQIPVELGGKRADVAWSFPENRSLDCDEVMACACPTTPPTAQHSS